MAWITDSLLHAPAPRTVAGKKPRKKPRKPKGDRMSLQEGER